MSAPTASPSPPARGLSVGRNKTGTRSSHDRPSTQRLMGSIVRPFLQASTKDVSPSRLRTCVFSWQNTPGAHRLPEKLVLALAKGACGDARATRTGKNEKESVGL